MTIAVPTSSERVEVGNASVSKRSVAARRGRDGHWLEDPGFGVYVHIPFCLHRCHYCDFNTYEGLEALYEPYAEALVRDIERAPDVVPPATSVFFGGGTPTLLSPPLLGRILTAIEARVGLAPGPEVTVEANPETVDEETFGALLDAGFNRFSIGVQSLAPHVLRGLGRTHSAERALTAVAAARRAGVEDLNLDLIYGSVWERPGDWEETLERVIAVAPDHISAYALTIEEGTPLATLVRTGRVPDVDPDVQAERHAVAREMLTRAGYLRYEISNWARPGRASAHNVLYWSAGDYLGFGAGAHGHLAGRRYWNVRLPRDLIARVDAGGRTDEGDEILDAPAGAGEALILGLRLAAGVNLSGFARRFGHAVLDERRAEIDVLVDGGLLEREPDRIRLSERGTMLANEVAARLL